MGKIKNAVVSLVLRRIKSIKRGDRGFKGYYFWRGILDPFLNNTDQIHAAYLFTSWINHNFKNKGTALDVKMSIVDVFIVNQTLFIRTTRPGLLIGVKGQTFDSLKKCFNALENVYLIEDFNNSAISIIRWK